MDRLIVGLRAARSAGAAAWSVFRSVWRGELADVLVSGPCAVTMACSHADVWVDDETDVWGCDDCGLRIG